VIGEQLQQLWTTFLSGGSLSPEEEAKLVAALRDDPQTCEALLLDFDLHRTLHGLGRSERDAQDFIRAFGRGLAAEGDATRFIQKVESRMEARGLAKPSGAESASTETAGVRRSSPRSVPGSRPGGKGAGSPVPALVAVGALVVILVLFAFSTTTPSPSDAGRGDRVRHGRTIEGPNRAQAKLGERDRPLAKEKDDLVQPPSPRPRESETRDLPRKGLPDPEKGREPQEPERKDALETPKKVEAPRPPAGVPSEEKLPPPAAPSQPKPEGRTLTAVATVEEVSGQAFLLLKDRKTPAVPGAGLAESSGLETGGKGARLVLRFSDRTLVELGPETLVRDVRAEGGKRLVLDRGVLRAVVSRQPEQEPMSFVTPHGAARVVGTTLRLFVDTDPKIGTRLEVEEGKVELKNQAGLGAFVESGQFAVAREGGELVARSVAIDEILLLPRQGTLVGNEWALVKDRAASSGSALYSRETSYKVRKVGANYVYDSVKSRPAYVLFNFVAEGGKDYHLWIRGRSLPEDPNHQLTSELAVEPANAQLGQADAQPALSQDNAYSYTGFFHYSGYGWIGGRGEFGKADAVPLSIRFARSGPQSLKIYVLQAPAWIDAVWLSATQKTRPEAGQTGPAKK
jgi:ferric-dicitrate binding protein FerR (iron transport regulator)